ncbi:TetR/AcrR family transcriptional regulator, partial [Rhodococcus erythropolis]|nr:TetR/AcrR family transcriptional regulator [Rhodococcus erythropolis]
GLGVAMLGEIGAGTASRARWIVRVILSLLMVPGADENDERTLVREFVAALLNAGRTT